MSWCFYKLFPRQAPSERCEGSAGARYKPRSWSYYWRAATKGAASPAGQKAGHGRQPLSGTPKGRDLSPPPPPGADTAASDPTSLEAQLLRTTKQNKGARRGRSHSAFQSPLAPAHQPNPPAAPRPLLGWPRTKAWAARPLVSPRPPVTAAGAAAQGQPGMGKPDGSIPPPSSALPPVPAARRPSAGARLARAHPRERAAFV